MSSPEVLCELINFLRTKDYQKMDLYSRLLIILKTMLIQSLVLTLKEWNVPGSKERHGINLLEVTVLYFKAI